MKILILSDSHSTLRLMRSAVEAIKPNAIVHLGDHFGDGEVIHEENPQIAFYQVPGNCDRHRMYQPRAEMLSYPVCGVRLYMTHGHNHHVKLGLYSLLQDAMAANAQAVLFGLNFKEMLVWIAAGSLFDVAHAVGNMAASVLVVPLATLLMRLEKQAIK